MSVILIIDDNIERGRNIKNTLIEMNNKLSEETFEFAYCLHQAKLKMRQKSYAAIFLDMALPQFNDSPSIDTNAGTKLLTDIKKTNVNAPVRIFGLTALNDNIEEKNKLFEELGFKLFYSPPGDLSWLTTINPQLNYAISAHKSVPNTEKDIAIITVHGIRTFGSWQERLTNLIKDANIYDQVEPLNFKFTGIDLFRFIFPPLRNKIVNRLYDDLNSWLSENRAKKIVCFSHSFGTFILIKAIEKFSDKSLTENISLIVLSGSVLKRDYNFGLVKNLCNASIINECSVYDFPLLLSESFIIGTGMAGKVGFNKLNTSKFINRYYNGGHSYFFDNKNEFMSKMWLPLIKNHNTIMSGEDDIKVNFLHQLLIDAAKLSSKIKYLYYAVLAWFILDFILQPTVLSIIY